MPASRGVSSSDAGAPEIEITPAMIEAGASALLSSDWRVVDHEVAAMIVYKAMVIQKERDEYTMRNNLDSSLAHLSLD